jgi:hypothetical protein
MLVRLSLVDDKGGDDLSDLVTTFLYRFCYNGVIGLNKRVLG